MRRGRLVQRRAGDGNQFPRPGMWGFRKDCPENATRVHRTIGKDTCACNTGYMPSNTDGTYSCVKKGGDGNQFPRPGMWGFRKDCPENATRVHRTIGKDTCACNTGYMPSNTDGTYSCRKVGGDGNQFARPGYWGFRKDCPENASRVHRTLGKDTCTCNTGFMPSNTDGVYSCVSTGINSKYTQPESNTDHDDGGGGGGMAKIAGQWGIAQPLISDPYYPDWYYWQYGVWPSFWNPLWGLRRWSPRWYSGWGAFPGSGYFNQHWGRGYGYGRGIGYGTGYGTGYGRSPGYGTGYGRTYSGRPGYSGRSYSSGVPGRSYSGSSGRSYSGGPGHGSSSGRGR